MSTPRRWLRPQCSLSLSLSIPSKLLRAPLPPLFFRPLTTTTTTVDKETSPKRAYQFRRVASSRHEQHKNTDYKAILFFIVIIGHVFHQTHHLIVHCMSTSAVGKTQPTNYNFLARWPTKRPLRLTSKESLRKSTSYVAIHFVSLYGLNLTSPLCYRDVCYTLTRNNLMAKHKPR